MNISLRKAVIQDSQSVLQWRNEASTIPWMGTPRALTFEEHNDWFARIIDSADNLFFIIEESGTAIGQIRYQKCSYEGQPAAKVSINITESMHGKGIASKAFQMGSELVRSLQFSDKIFAYVLPHNLGSIKAMEKAGYVKLNTAKIHDADHIVMINEGPNK